MTDYKYNFDVRDNAAKKYDELLEKCKMSENGELSHDDMRTFSFLMLDVLEMTENPLTVLRQAHQHAKWKRETEGEEQRRRESWGY